MPNTKPENEFVALASVEVSENDPRNWFMVWIVDDNQKGVPAAVEGPAFITQYYSEWELHPGSGKIPIGTPRGGPALTRLFLPKGAKFVPTTHYPLFCTGFYLR